jgi:glycosyltransferase involved in cell wall biosynthesis
LTWRGQTGVTKPLQTLGRLALRLSGAKWAVVRSATGRNVKISVVVPCLNARHTLGRQLAALAHQTEAPWEVIVADNGSTDGSVAIANGFAGAFARFKVVNAGEHLGASFARNRGAEAADGDVLAFCDADDEVAPDWLAALRRALERHDFVASRFDLTKLNGRTRDTGQQATGLIRDRDFGFLPRAGTGGLAVRKHIHNLVGGFDESIRFHEDSDYCFKIQMAGHPLVFAPDALVHVQERRGPKAKFQQSRRWAVSQVGVYKKYRRQGMGKASNREALREWLRLARMLARAVRSRHMPDHLAWRLGVRLGRLQGSLIHRVVLL